MKKRKKKYTPPKRYNPAVQANRLDKLSEQIELHRRNIEAISKSHDNHISYLGNFAKHDIKNAIQSMDSILTTTGIEEFDETKIGSLSTYLEVIRGTINNFSKLVPYSSNGKFKIDILFIAVELLSRTEIATNKIEFKLDFDRNLDTEIDLPFQSLLQMLNNLLINSIKSLEGENEKKIYLKAEVKDTELIIMISDNGKIIPSENQQRVFEYGFSTTGGSGIGLYHAKYLCDQFDGSISVSLTEKEELNKTFIIKLPI